MDTLDIPATATEEYLEHLEVNIIRQLKKTKNNRVRAHLLGMLREVRKRLKEFRKTSQEELEELSVDDLGVLELTDVVEEVSEEPPVEDKVLLEKEQEQEFQQEPDQAGAEDSDVLVLTDIIEEMEEPPGEDDTLSEKEREILKDRLKGILKKFQDRKQTFPQQPDSLVLTDIMQEISEETPFDSTDLSEQQQEKIKSRLKIILGALHQMPQELSQETADQFLIETLTERGKVPLDEVGPSIGEQETAQVQAEEVSAEIQKEQRKFRPLSSDAEFAEICEKVSQGHSLKLFDSIALSEREQDLVSTFVAHLSSYKGLKKQQAFEMQHLTARSINELDLIFKTYHLQGYLRAELTNVYNRLLNLRSRFSILLN